MIQTKTKQTREQWWMMRTGGKTQRNMTTSSHWYISRNHNNYLLHYMLAILLANNSCPGICIVGNDLAGPLTVNILVGVKIVNRVYQVQKLNYMGIMH